METKKTKSYAEIAEFVKDIDISVLNHSIIQDNKIIFPYNSKVYRCRMPSQIEETHAEGVKNKLKIQLLERAKIAIIQIAYEHKLTNKLYKNSPSKPEDMTYLDKKILLKYGKLKDTGYSWIFIKNE